MDKKRSFMAESSSAQSVAMTPIRKEFLEEVFGERECGEPLAPQHVVLDFTPSAEDTPFMEKKCCAFWDLVRNSPELQNLMVFPDTVSFTQAESDSAQQTSSETAPSEPHPSITAVSVFEFLEKKDMIEDCFETQLPYTTCSLSSVKYPEEKPVPWNTTQQKPGHKRNERKLSSKKQKSIQQSSREVKDLCKKMHDWDIHHPKSMEPPSHPPKLTHCALQRN